jgi:RHS repeat-associated protein
VLEETYNSSTGKTTLSAVNVYGADGWRVRDYPGPTVAATDDVFYAFSFDPQGNVVSKMDSDNTANPGYDLASYEGYGHRAADILAGTGQSPAPHQDPARFGGEYGYYTDYSTGLLCLTHRYYDPGTGRFVTRDPSGYGGGVNLYGFAGDNPVNEMDPSGLKGVVIFVHGSFSDPGTWTYQERGAVERTFQANHVVFFNWAYHRGKSNTSESDIQGTATDDLIAEIDNLKQQYPQEPIAVVAHSNGGNVAVDAAQMGAPIDTIVRLGTPPQNALSWVPGNTSVIDAYDIGDPVAFGYAKLFGFPAGLSGRAKSQPNWRPVSVIAPIQFPDPEIHLSMQTPQVWKQLKPTLMRYGNMNRFLGP